MTEAATQYRELLRYRSVVTVEQREKGKALRAKQKQAALKARTERQNLRRMHRYVQQEARKMGVELDEHLNVVSINGIPNNTFAQLHGKQIVDRLIGEYKKILHLPRSSAPQQEKPKAVRKEPPAPVPKVSVGVWPPRPKKEPVDLLQYVVTEGGSDPESESASELSTVEPSSTDVLNELVQRMLEESKKDPDKKTISLTYTESTDVVGMYRLAGEPLPDTNAQAEYHKVGYDHDGSVSSERVIRNDLPAKSDGAAGEVVEQAASDAPMGELLWEEVESLEAQVRHWRSEYEDAQKELHEAHGARRRAEELLLAGKKEEGASCPTETALTLARLCVNPNLSVTPVEALRTAAELFPNRIVVLPSAYESADKVDRNFKRGGRLLKLLLKLGTDYFDVLTEKGDAEARKVFSPSEYSACESDTVRTGGLGRLRDFVNDGAQIRMEQHLKIGIAANTSVTLRCYFAWIAQEKKFVIGYCGEHLPVASHRT